MSKVNGCRAPQAPLFNDPIYDGASDPTLIWNHFEKQWWIVYTQRRATSPGPGVTGVHGSDLGVASSPDGHDWLYRGTLQGLEFEPGRNTWWAPEILYYKGLYHMYASYVRGMPIDWNRPRRIIHYTSKDLWHWSFESVLKLDSERVIDACVARLPSGIWRMWYKDESDNSYSHFADSDDLYGWKQQGRAIDTAPHEGSNVFFFDGVWWYIGDFWNGLGVYRSLDCERWESCGTILDTPGLRKDDAGLGHHADILVRGKDAYIFYFTHKDGGKTGISPRTSIQAARLSSDGNGLICNRDEEFDFLLTAPADGEPYC